ncbi:ImmA/IrrE family metallo-endopeptidase [Sphingomonas sp. HF-S3]|uniref:ImmA/IrrE family metallo-endopeptidase n=1 Tax=Sphingomonas rustica TaxID=3103142 RepID=A0ABV0BBU9_9SPHN
MSRIKDSWQWQQLSDEQRAIITAHQSSVPVNLGAIAREFGVPVKAATLGPGVSGEIRPNPDGGYIIRVNRHDSPRRQRFTVAHELAHFLLHKDQIGSGITDDALYRSNKSSRIEAEANRLAADLVMPTAKVRAAADELRASDVSDLSASLAERFGVSDAAMTIKLGGE